MAVRFTYHGSPFAQQIMNQGFKPGGLMSIAPGQVFSSPNAAFASSYGSPVRMVTPTSALSIPSANLNMKTIGSEVIQSPKAATKGMNLASKVGTTYTGPTAQRLMSGATVAGLGAPPSSSLAMRLAGGPFGLAALAGQGIGYGVDAIARATNTPEEYEAMKEAARVSGGTGYFDFTDEELGITSPTVAEQVISEVNIPDTISGNFGTPGAIITDGPGTYEVNPDGQTASLIGRPTMADIAGMGDLGNPTGDSRVVSEELGMVGRPTTNRPTMAEVAGDIDLNLTDLGNPLGDSRVVSEEMGLVGGIPDRGRGMPGTMGAFEMIGGTPVAIGDKLGRQMALEKADFFEAPKSKVDLGSVLSLAGLLSGSNVVKGLGMIANRDKIGRMAGNVRSGLGSLGTKVAGKMRGINPTTGRPNTQAEYERARADRQAQARTDRMIDRISQGKKTRSNPRDAGKTQAQKDAISAAMQDARRGGQYSNDGGGGSGGGKVVCTMMNERYGFGSFRNKIWMKFHENHGPEYQKGYHAIFLPLVKIAKGEGKINTAVRKVLEHMGRHVTADMFKIMKGKKRDPLGRIYRDIFEPTCRIIGKIKSALGRG